MEFIDFCRAHGLVVDTLVEGRWVRTRTTDKASKKNGAYKYMGTHGFVQNHATMLRVETWKPDGTAPRVDLQAIAERAAAFERKERQNWMEAAHRAEVMMKTAKVGEHGYLQRKGLRDVPGLVLPDEALFVPMRHVHTNALVGAQLIRWLPEERQWQKKMIYGMKARGAVFRIGPTNVHRTFLVEGLATGYSVEQACRLLRLNAAVIVTFSDSNLVQVAAMTEGHRIVVADNDESGAGLRAAERTGLPYCMPEKIGEDFNDLHVRAGLYAAANILMRPTPACVAPSP
jgi:putative DNA primase/helicase